MCFIADGYNTVQTENVIKRSRKAHKCSDCFKTIPIASSYKSIFCVYEGDASTFKICEQCQSLREGIVLVEIAAGCHRNEAEPLLGAMFEQLGESEPEGYHGKLIELGRKDDAAWLAANCNFSHGLEHECLTT